MVWSRRSLSSYPVGTVQRGGLLLGVAAPDGKQKEGNEEWYRFSHYSWLYNYLVSFLFLFIDFPESPMTAGIRCDSRIEIVAAEIGPVCRGEVEFAVCSLPEQEVAQTLFSAGADYQVGVGDSAGIEFAGYRFGSYLRGESSPETAFSANLRAARVSSPREL